MRRADNAGAGNRMGDQPMLRSDTIEAGIDLAGTAHVHLVAVAGAVIDAGVPVDAIRTALDSLGLPITLEVERVIRCGFAATGSRASPPT